MRKQKQHEVVESPEVEADVQRQVVSGDLIEAGDSSMIENPGPTTATTETDSRYVDAIENVRQAMADYSRSVWRLAWALLEFKAVHAELHPQDRLTDKQLAELLGINLTPARIGQLVNTAAAYPREEVDESIEFRVYQEARTLTAKQPRMTPQKRLALVKKHPTTMAIAKLRSAKSTSPRSRRELVIVAGVVDGRADEVDIDVSARLGVHDSKLPTQLRIQIEAYARELFFGREGDAQQTGID